MCNEQKAMNMGDVTVNAYRQLVWILNHLGYTLLACVEDVSKSLTEMKKHSDYD